MVSLLASRRSFHHEMVVKKNEGSIYYDRLTSVNVAPTLTLSGSTLKGAHQPLQQ